MHDFCSRGNGSTLMECCNCWHDFTCAPIPSCWPGLGCVLWIAKVSSHTCVLPYLHCNSLWCTHRTVLCCVGTASFKLLMSYLLICLLIPAFQPFWCAPGSWVWGNWITITVALYLCTEAGRGTRSVSRGHISFSTCRTCIFVQFSLMNNKRIFLCFSPMNNFCTKLKELWREGNFCFADGWINIHSRNNNQVFLTAIKIFSVMGVLTYSLSPFNFL